VLPERSQRSDAATAAHQKHGGPGFSRWSGKLIYASFRNATRSHIRRTTQSILSHLRLSLIRFPLQTSRLLWLQYRQIACWTNRGKVCGKRAIELPGVDPLSHACNDLGAATWSVAGHAVSMFCLSVEEIPPGELSIDPAADERSKATINLRFNELSKRF
jgi:hypothetical protein